jgi:predicted site-specific integrase-resolvase
MSPKELADFLEVSPATIRRQVRSDAIPYFYIGNQIRFLPGAVIKKLMLTRKKTKPT